MSRILGIDYGTRRMGVAVSDALGMIATPVSVEPVTSMEEAVAAAVRVARAKGASTLVVGLPINMDGTLGPMAQEVLAFVEKLKAVGGFTVATTDERLSTSMVERVLVEADLSRGRRKEVRDKLAAQVILQGYLDAHPSDLDPDLQDR